MNPFEPPVILTKDYILSKVSPEEIFRKYLGITPEFNQQYCNPLRSNDNHPGCNFYIDSRGVIKFRDYAGNFSWDCFNVVEYAERTDFKGALKKIAEDFNIISGGTRVLDKSITVREYKKRHYGIRIKRRTWDKSDLAWWGKFYITKEILTEFNVSPVSDVWLLEDENEQAMKKVYYYKTDDPCYAYHFGGYEYKLYYPFRKNVRFIQSPNHSVEGLNQLPKQGGKNLLLTKSYKDVMCFRIFRDEFKLHTIAPASEGVLLDKELFTDLYNSFENIATLFDFDRAGIRSARKYNETYQLPFFFFGAFHRRGIFKVNEGGIKDFADYLSLNGIEKTRELIQREYERAGIIN